jgi:hypothetical protein
VPFDIHIPDSERAYLDGLSLSPEAKERINLHLEQFLANLSDEFRHDPLNRPGPDPRYLLIRHIILDREGDGRFHTIDFYIDDSSAACGVLLIVYIDFH